MRKFSDIEMDTIKRNKPKCNKAEGETYSLTRSRYTKSCVGTLPGDWRKTCRNIRFELEISPNERPYTLDFRISGAVPCFDGAGKAYCEYRDILVRTVDWSVDTHPEPNCLDENRKPVEGPPVKPEDELWTVVGRFFGMAAGIISGYTYLFDAMKYGYRFTNKVYGDSCFELSQFSPEDFMK